MNDEAPTQRLREEHQLILKVVGVLSEIVTAAERGSAVDWVSLDRCISFFRLFIDAFHHGKEEDLLFPELGNLGMPRDAGPIAVMLLEHDEGRAHIKTMAGAIEGARRGDAEALGVLLAEGRGYIDLIRRHIPKEDMVLFPMADQMILGAERTRICGAYDLVGDRVFDGQAVIDLRTIAADLVEKYPPR